MKKFTPVELPNFTNHKKKLLAGSQNIEEKGYNAVVSFGFWLQAIAWRTEQLEKQLEPAAAITDMRSDAGSIAQLKSALRQHKIRVQVEYNYEDRGLTALGRYWVTVKFYLQAPHVPELIVKFATLSDGTVEVFKVEPGASKTAKKRHAKTINKTIVKR
jgi:hypothetical protein